MSQPVASSPTTEPLPPPPSDYDKIFGRAITDYKKQTGQDPRIASRAYKFESPDAVLLVLRDKVDAFDFRDGSKVLMDWLESYVYLVFTVSEKLRAREGSTEVVSIQGLFVLPLHSPSLLASLAGVNNLCRHSSFS
jgi:hypothetical protein